jgi:tetratricopeptide (TPR) repeat protein
MTNVHEIIEKARAANQRLPSNEATVLFAAALRLAAAQGATLRARLVQIDDTGGLHLAAFDDKAPETEPGYLAPELLQVDAPRKSEPRVQVYAAGALGFELLTGHVPPGNPAELSGPLGDIVRMALAPDRRERFGDLSQLQDALEGVQPRPPAEGERNIFAALRARWTRPPPEKEALARLIEKLGSLETQVAALAKAQTKLETLQARLDSVQRETQETLERFEDGQSRLKRPAASAFGPALLASLVSAGAVVGAGFALGLLSLPRSAPPQSAALPPPASPAPAPAAIPPAAIPDAAVAVQKVPRDAAATADEKPAAAEPRPEPADAGAAAAAAEAASDAGEIALAPPADAGAVAAPVPTPARAPAPARRKPPEVTQAALLHAVAISQVRRGEAALEKGQADEAQASFRAALDNEATLAVAYRGLGMAYAMQNNDSQALQAYEKYLNLAPSAPDRSDIRRSIAELKTRAKIGSGEK